MDVNRLFSLLKPPEVLSKESQQAYQGKVKQAKQESQMIREKVVNPFFSFADKSFKKIMEVMNPGESYVAPALKKLGVNPIVAGGIGLGVDILAPGPGELGRVAKVGKEVKVGSELLQEAKKYKTAEEFVRGQVDASDNSIKNKFSDLFEQQLKGTGLEGESKNFTDGIMIRGKIESSKLSPEVEDADAVDDWVRKIREGERPEIYYKVENDGYINIVDGSHKAQAYKNLGIKEIPAVEIKTKSQLTDIWNKANKKTK